MGNKELAHFETEYNRITGGEKFIIADTYNSDCGLIFETKEELEQFVKELKVKAQELMGWKL